MDPGQLYIRWSETGSDDNRTDPGNAVWWMSKAIGIRRADGAAQDAGLALTGVDQFIRVNVSTLLTKSHVAVQAWVCAYGTAGQPYLASAGGRAGLLKDLDDQAIPQPYTATAGPELSVDLPWVPDASDLTSVGLTSADELHVCLLANCYATPPSAAPDGAQITAQPPPINVPTNRHHGQHNITLRGMGESAGGMGMKMFAGNPDADGEDVFELLVEEQRLERLDERLIWLVRNSRWADWLAEGGELRPAKAAAGELRLTVAGDSGPRVRVPLTASKPELMTLEFETGGRETGVVRVFDVVQRRGDDVAGGARLVTVALPDDVFEDGVARHKSAA
jgi:hypothetical protein